MGSFWSRLSLRVQAIIAVLLPCLAVAAFASIYFPNRLNQQAGEALERQARSVGLLAVSNAAPTVRLIGDALASPDELDAVLEGVQAGGNVDAAAVLSLSRDTVRRDGERRTVLVEKDSKAVVRAFSRRPGSLPPGRYEVPQPAEGRAKGCELERGETLVVRCVAADKGSETMVVAVYSLAELREAERENYTVGLWVLAAAVVVGLALALLFSGALAGPMGLITRVAREVAGGDVSVPAVEVSGSGEVASMASSINDMLAKLRGLVTQMVGLTQRLTGAAQGLIAASADQEHVTSQQSAYAQQIAATFEELSRTAEMITASTEVVEQAATRTSSTVDDARAVVGEMVQGMTEIRRESKEVAEVIARLNTELQQVSRIAQVIKQVADRSDLLALNAALEGTKAGEVGRGFSLVAAEMRKLAESVAVSARDIGRIVESVQASGDQAVVKAREGVNASDRGVTVAERASESFQQILELSRGTRDAAQQIAVATRQQRQSAEQAVQGARNVADFVKQAVDATGRTTKIAQDLQSAVSALTDVTKSFRTERR